jgi:hypothetical protein
MERATYYLGHIEELYLAASPALKQRFLREVLEEVRVRDRAVVAFAPKTAYLPFFALDRLERGKDHSDVKVDIGSPGRIPRDIWQLPPRILGVEALDLAALASL